MVTTKQDEFKYVKFLADIANTSVQMCSSFMDMDQLVDYQERAAKFLLTMAEKRYGSHA